MEVKNLTKKFGKFMAVNDISFNIKEGEILGFLGPNGAGKTTTIDMILGLTKPTSGEIRIFGLPFDANRSKILKQMNFSAAYISLPGRLKVFEILYTFARLYEVSNYKNKIGQLLTEFQLNDFRNKIIMDLSSGQLARLCICKAFINNPKLLLLDEPTVYLDPDIADFTRKYIVKKVQTEGITVLFTSHNMAEITELCDRVIFLNKGRIIAEDTPALLAKKIKSCRVKLLFDVAKERVEMLLKNYAYNSWEDGKEIVIEINEENIGQLLGRLSLAKLKYTQITIEKPTLEDFFLKIARDKII